MNIERILRGIREKHSRMDAEEETGSGKRSGLGTRLPYALCKDAGIDTTGMTPSEAWDAYMKATGEKKTPSEIIKDKGKKSKSKDTPKPKDSSKSKEPDKAKEEPGKEPEKKPDKKPPKPASSNDYKVYENFLRNHTSMGKAIGENLVYEDEEGRKYTFDNDSCSVISEEDGSVVNDGDILSGLKLKLFDGTAKQNDERFEKMMTHVSSSNGGSDDYYSRVEAIEDYLAVKDLVDSGEITTDDDKYTNAVKRLAKVTFRGGGDVFDTRKEIIRQFAESGGDPLKPVKIGKFKRGKDMSFEEADSGKPNPKYGSYKYDVNCQTCVVAMEARLRGYNLSAKAKVTRHQDELSRASERAYINPETGKAPEIIRDGYEKVRTEKEKVEFFERIIKPGERYNFKVTWKGHHSGHVVSISRKPDGKLAIYDPQVNRTYSGYALTAFLYDTDLHGSFGSGLYRIDNCVLNLNLINDIFEETT